MRALFNYWDFNLITVALIFLLCLFYFYLCHFKLKKQAVYFFSGIVLLIICTSSPLHFLGEHYLFSAHMITHTIVLLLAAPLMVAGIPQENRFKNKLILLSERTKKYPFYFWITGVAMMWIWHVPFIFNHMFTMHQMMGGTMQPMSVLHYLHTISLLFAGIVFCWPIIHPYTFKMPILKSVLYLTTACIFCSLLGLLITFAPVGIYTPYLTVRDMYGFLPMIRNDWGISVATDQQIGGLIMWVPCCFIYLSAAMYLLLGWFNENKAINTVQLVKI